MNAGVEILLGRMDSHPEEFEDKEGPDAGNSRWGWVMWQVRNPERGDLSFLTQEEMDALQTKYRSIQGEAFTRRVMRELLVDKVEEPEVNTALPFMRTPFPALTYQELLAKTRSLGINNPEAQKKKRL